METRNASRIESDHNFALSDQTSDLAVDCLFKKEKLFAALSLYYNLHCNITLLLGIFLDISEPFWDMQRIWRNWLFITNLEKLKFDEIYSKYRNESSLILIFLRVLKVKARKKATILLWLQTDWQRTLRNILRVQENVFYVTPFALEAFSLPQKWSLIKHQSAGQEDILGQETYSNVYKIGARNLNIFIFEHEVKQ